MKIVVAVLLCLPLAWAGCDFPPHLWCSSGEIAKKCNVYNQCLQNSVKVTDAGPVNFTLYYESLCPDCRSFMKRQLFSTWQTLGSDVLNITLVPYGNAREEKTPFGDWKFTCQHGPEECVGNLIDVCAISILKDFKTYFPYIHCMEISEDTPETSGEQCAQDQGIDYAPIKACANGKMGNALEHQMAEITDALNPPHKYVPWVTLNDVHTEKINDEAMRDLLSLVCKTYKGPTPSGCHRLNLSRDQKCYKN